MTMRVLFVIGSMGGGGSERQVVTLLQRLDRAAFAPLLYLSHRSGPLLAEVPGDVPVVAFWDDRAPPRLNWPGRIHGMLAADLAQTIQRERIEAVYDRTYHATLIAGPATAKTQTPRLSVIVSDPRLDLERNERRFVWHKRRLLRRAYHQASRVIAVSHGVRRAAMGYYGLPPEKIVTIPNPVDLERIRRLASEESPALAAGLFHVVSVGRLHPAKGCATLLEAADELVNQRRRGEVRIHLVGVGPLEAELKSFVEQRGLERHVTFWGFLDNPLPLVRQASLFCLPSLYEGNSNALLEAMACGAPALAADAPGGIRETLDDGRLGVLVPPADAQALARQIERAMAAPEALQAMAAAAQRHVEEKLRLEDATQRLESLLREIARP